MVDTVTIPRSFLRFLLEVFVDSGQEHARSDEQIEGYLRERAAYHGVEDIDALVQLAFRS